MVRQRRRHGSSGTAPRTSPLLVEGSTWEEGSFAKMESSVPSRCASQNAVRNAIWTQVPCHHLGLPRHLWQVRRAPSTDNTAPGERGLGGSPWQRRSGVGPPLRFRRRSCGSSLLRHTHTHTHTHTHSTNTSPGWIPPLVRIVFSLSTTSERQKEGRA